MDSLSHLRGMIASLDEELVDSLCTRARQQLNPHLYAMPGLAVPSLDLLAGQFSGSITLAGRVHVLRPAYLQTLLPSLCAEGNEGEGTLCLSADTACLNALAKRLTLSVHVATRKREAIPEALQAAILTGEPARVEDAITNPAVEAEVLERVQARARKHGPLEETPGRIAACYADWIIPLSRKIQVHGLLAKS